MRVTGLRSRAPSGSKESGDGFPENERESAAADPPIPVARRLKLMTAPQKTALLAVLGICALIIAVSLSSDSEPPQAEQKSNYVERQQHQILQRELAVSMGVHAELQLGSEELQRLAGVLANKRLYEELDAFQADSCRTNLMLLNSFTSADGSKHWDLTCVGCAAVSMFSLPESISTAADRGATGQPPKIGLTDVLSLVGICPDR